MSDLEASLAFYREAFSFEPLHRDADMDYAGSQKAVKDARVRPVRKLRAVDESGSILPWRLTSGSESLGGSEAGRSLIKLDGEERELVDFEWSERRLRELAAS